MHNQMISDSVCHQHHVGQILNGKCGSAGSPGSFRGQQLWQLGTVYGLCKAIRDNGSTLCYDWKQLAVISHKVTRLGCQR